MADKTCGVLTNTGKPCNMPKGHAAKFHRYREYDPPMAWRIKDPKGGKVIEFGEGRMALGYAITNNLKKRRNLIIEVER